MLFEAIRCSDEVKKIKALVEQGADIHADNFDGWSTLHYAAYYGQVKHISWLLNQGLDVNCRTYGGETPLVLARSTCQIDAANFLKMKGGQR